MLDRETIECAREIACKSALRTFAQADVFRDIENTALCRNVASEARELRKAYMNKAFMYLAMVNDCTDVLRAL